MVDKVVEETSRESYAYEADQVVTKKYEADQVVTKKAAVWQNTEFNSSTFDYQWTVQDAKALLTSYTHQTQLETPPFKTHVTVRNSQTGEVCTPSWKLLLKSSKVRNFSRKRCECCKITHNYSGFVTVGIEISGGLELQQDESTGVWVDASVSILKSNYGCESVECTRYIPSTGGDKGEAIELKYMHPEYYTNFFPFKELESYLVDNSLTLYVKINTRVFEAPMQTFVETLPDVTQSIRDNTFNLGPTLNEARKNGSYTDVTLVCGEREFQVHRVVLATQSQFFKARFKEHWTKEDNKIVMSDISPDTLEAVLTFMYTGEIETIHNGELVKVLDVLKAAAEYQVTKLQALCERDILRILTDDNVIDTLITAEQHKLHQLEEACMTHILKNPSKVRQTESWESLKESDDFRSLYIKVLEKLTDLLICPSDTTDTCERAVFEYMEEALPESPGFEKF